MGQPCKLYWIVTSTICGELVGGEQLLGRNILSRLGSASSSGGTYKAAISGENFQGISSIC